jgi:Paraquat-inducible protein B
MAEQDIPEAQIASPQIGRRHSRVLLVWLVPIVAALVGIGLVIRAMLAAGPTITVSFQTAEGLQAGKTEVKYKNVVVGRVTSIRLTRNFKGVVVTIDLTHNAAKLAVADTRFWVVRPRVDWGGVSGLNTLLSGAYIGVDVGSSKTPKRRFAGLSEPPAILHDQKGRRFLLHARTLGSLNIGSKIYYRKFAVGRVAGYKLDQDGQGVTIQLFVRAPYDNFVTRETHFWNASGVDLAVNANGLKLATESVASVLAGGVGFGQPSGVKDFPTRTAGHALRSLRQPRRRAGAAERSGPTDPHAVPAVDSRTQRRVADRLPRHPARPRHRHPSGIRSQAGSVHRRGAGQGLSAASRSGLPDAAQAASVQWPG